MSDVRRPAWHDMPQNLLICGAVLALVQAADEERELEVVQVLDAHAHRIVDPADMEKGGVKTAAQHMQNNFFLAGASRL